MQNYVVIHNETSSKLPITQEFALIPADIPQSRWRPRTNFILALLALRVFDFDTCFNFFS